MRFHHVQLSMPPNQEELARKFYRDALKLEEVKKPPLLADRGGCWFRENTGDDAPLEFHLGVEPDFVPSKKPHPAILVETQQRLMEIAEAIEAAGFNLSWQERDSFEGYLRFHTRDGFGNRLEIMTPLAA